MIILNVEKKRNITLTNPLQIDACIMMTFASLYRTICSRTPAFLFSRLLYIILPLITDTITELINEIRDEFDKSVILTKNCTLRY